MDPKNLADEYAERAQQRSSEAAREQTRFNLVGNLRLAAALIAVLLCFFVFGQTALDPLWLIPPALAFFVLVVVHSRIQERLDRAKRSLRFYEQGLARIEDRWMGLGEQGLRFMNPEHVYSGDLDLFGKGSLFELLCTARTRAGEDTLADWLLHPASPAEIRGRQEAVAELGPRLDLREELALIGEDIRAGLHTEALSAWAEAAPVQFFPGLRPLAVVVSAATTISLICTLAGWTDRVVLLVCVLAQMSLSLAVRMAVRAVIAQAELPSHDLELLSGLLQRIEREPVNSACLRGLKDRLRAEGRLASQQIGRLEALANKLEWQHNMFFRPVAALLLWSTHLAVAIEHWRAHSGKGIRTWIGLAGEFEAICALAVYHAEHPGYPFPELTEDQTEVKGEALGHPLLPASQCVANDIALSSATPLLVVSGSNMSGKSTFLRTAGLNVVLALAGAPVRAKSLTVSQLQVAASMRVQDSLQDGRSRFYAEITRLREIVELTSRPTPVLFLLDELLSGTNSHDREIGASAIARTLVEHGAIGMLTTHDLALAHIAEILAPPGKNVHFADTIEDGRLHFDFKLQPGVVERSNALELMRSVGLQI